MDTSKKQLHKLQYPKFIFGIAEDIEKELQEKYPEISPMWLSYDLCIEYAVEDIVSIFIKEVARGHIFYDDLFGTTLEKYSNNHIPYYPDENERIINYFNTHSLFRDMDWTFIREYTSSVKMYLLCYDFCKQYISCFYPLIYELNHLTHLDQISSNSIIGEKQPSAILKEAVKKKQQSILQLLEHKGLLSYLDTSNNLVDVLARLPKMLDEIREQLAHKPIIALNAQVKNTPEKPIQPTSSSKKDDKEDDDDKEQIGVVYTYKENDGAGIRGFNAVAGLQNLKEQLQSDIVDVIRCPERAQALKLSLPNGFLLYGPPGCGKTYFAKKLAEEMKCNFIYVDCSDLASTYIHGTQKKIRQVFDQAREFAPCLVFLDEVDQMITKREMHNNSSMRGEVNVFLTQLNNCGEEGIVVIGATNRPQDIDSAALRSGRLENKYYFPLPDLETRSSIFAIHLHGVALNGAVDLSKLAELTEGYVSADIEKIVKDAKRVANRRKVNYLSMDMFEEAIREIKPSVSKAEIREHEAIRDKFEGRKQEYQRIGFC